MPRTALQKAREAPSSTKARILAAAEEVFAAKGFEGASTREIAASAGVNISSLHYHWESKETLYFAVFENIYDQMVDLVERATRRGPRDKTPSRGVIDESMGSLFDFFADRPNVAKLLVRRLLEADESTSEIERDILLPAWQRFGRWMVELSGARHDELEAHTFMLTVNSVLLLFMLDSQQFVALLDGSVRSPAIRPRVRAHVIRLVHTLLAAK